MGILYPLKKLHVQRTLGLNDLVSQWSLVLLIGMNLRWQVRYWMCCCSVLLFCLYKLARTAIGFCLQALSKSVGGQDIADMGGPCAKVRFSK